ncbi:CRISPR-associated endoribonuclease Cas6 [Kroppenstedtia pulmonis]|uniref:CRISPR-associated endoribonuclease Cas6 n=1 Tax=Kroppenstedtia pulmonis TaxID=1380685 RepID=UPI001FE7C39C|nr:CRISPR-associated endoribonuclease Cas6 [Kroppenstedtia pulmonis]
MIKIRLSVVLEAEDLKIPVQYQQTLQGLIYRSLSNPELATFLHDQGYLFNEKRSFKMFTFSRLFGKSVYDSRQRMLTFQGVLRWHISSALTEFIQNLGQAFLLQPAIQLSDQDVTVKEVTYSNSSITSSNCRIRMLSPITVASTFQSTDGKKVTHFFSPDDLVFSHMIEENLKRKYKAFTGQDCTDSFQITPLSVTRKDKVVTKFKGIIINAWAGTYEIRSTPQMLTFAYQAGLGGRNSQGFGMFEVLDEQPPGR